MGSDSFRHKAKAPEKLSGKSGSLFPRPFCVFPFLTGSGKASKAKARAKNRKAMPLAVLLVHWKWENPPADRRKG